MCKVQAVVYACQVAVPAVLLANGLLGCHTTSMLFCDVCRYVTIYRDGYGSIALQELQANYDGTPVAVLHHLVRGRLCAEHHTT